MVTLRLLAEQVRSILGDRQGSRFHPLEVIKAVGQVRDDFIRIDYFNQIQLEGREIAPELISTREDVPVQRDDEKDREWINLPWQWVRLPKGRGIFHIGPMEDEFTTFVPAMPGDLTLLRNHPAYHMEGEHVYHIVGKTARFTGPVKDNHPYLLVRMVRASESFHQDEELTLPPDSEQLIVMKTVELLRHKMPEDNVIDNTDKL